MIQTLLLSSLPASALLVITTQSPVISVLALVIYTTFLAVILFTNGFSFVAILYVVVYVGAVAILFIFVLMIIDVRESEISNIGKNYTKNLPITLFITAIAFYTFYKTQIPNLNIRHPALSESNVFTQSTFTSEIQAFASAFYGFSSFHFLLVSLLLLTAMIGPITLCLQTTRNH